MQLPPGWGWIDPPFYQIDKIYATGFVGEPSAFTLQQNHQIFLRYEQQLKAQLGLCGNRGFSFFFPRIPFVSGSLFFNDKFTFLSGFGLDQEKVCRSLVDLGSIINFKPRQDRDALRDCLFTKGLQPLLEESISEISAFSEQYGFPFDDSFNFNIYRAFLQKCLHYDPEKAIQTAKRAYLPPVTPF